MSQLFVLVHYLKVLALHDNIPIIDSLVGLLLFVFACIIKMKFPTYVDHKLLAFLRRTGLNKLRVESTLDTVTMDERAQLSYILDRLPAGRGMTVSNHSLSHCVLCCLSRYVLCYLSHCVLCCLFHLMLTGADTVLLIWCLPACVHRHYCTPGGCDRPNQLLWRCNSCPTWWRWQSRHLSVSAVQL